MTFDVYQNIKDELMRIATAPNAGLPPHIKPDEWRKMKPGELAIIEQAGDDIAALGFCIYRLAEKPLPTDATLNYLRKSVHARR